MAAHNNLQASNEMAKLKADVEKHKTDLAEMKHLNSKLKKNLGDKAEELHHCQRKGDNSDKEVRSLRLRIEQLKQELGEAQDDIDSTTTTIRRLERTNEELSSQCEGTCILAEYDFDYFLRFRTPGPSRTLDLPIKVNAKRFSLSKDQPCFCTRRSDLCKLQHDS